MSIKVLLVDDSPVVRSIMKKSLTVPGIEIVAEATNGLEALDLFSKLHPDVICTDLNMPRMNGLELTRAVMEKKPTPILVVSSAVDKNDKDMVFSLLDAGAVDVILKPRGMYYEMEDTDREEMVKKIKIASGVSVFTKHRRKAPSPPPQVQDKPRSTAPWEEGSQKLEFRRRRNIRIVAIGASTGGPQSYARIFQALRPDFTLPIVCVQHINEGFTESLIEWLGKKTNLNVCMAVERTPPAPGNIYFPRDNCHLLLDKGGYFVYSSEGLVDGHRPSVTATFRSIASHYGGDSLAILLTGMGRDGAQGLKEIRESGGMTIVQDEQSCVVFGMPRVALELGAASYVLPLSQIAEKINQLIYYVGGAS